MVAVRQLMRQTMKRFVIATTVGLAVADSTSAANGGVGEVRPAYPAPAMN